LRLIVVLPSKPTRVLPKWVLRRPGVGEVHGDRPSDALDGEVAGDGVPVVGERLDGGRDEPDLCKRRRVEEVVGAQVLVALGVARVDARHVDRAPALAPAPAHGAARARPPLRVRHRCARHDGGGHAGRPDGGTQRRPGPRSFVDLLTPEEVDVLGEVFARVRDSGACASSPSCDDA
jgi:hypothetical protein